VTEDSEEEALVVLRQAGCQIPELNALRLSERRRRIVELGFNALATTPSAGPMLPLVPQDGTASRIR
jgi:hypothetical protein